VLGRPRHAVAPARRLAELLPDGHKQTSLSWAKIRAFLHALKRMPGMAPLPFRFVVLTALRYGECAWRAGLGSPFMA